MDVAMPNIMMLVYSAIAYVLPLILAVWAFLVSEDERAKWVIGGFVFLLYVGSFFLHLSSFVWYFGRIVLGIGCFLYLRWHGIAVK